MGEIERNFLEFRSTGRPRALGRVFDSAAPELLLIAGQLARDASEAEDLVHDTLVTAIEQRARFDADRRLMPWLLGILINLNRSRRRKTTEALSPDWPGTSMDPVDLAAASEVAERLDACLASLPESYREPLRLRLVHGLEPVQIARALGRPLETVRTQLQRGRKLLRDALPASLVPALWMDLGLGSGGLEAMRKSLLEAARARVGLPTGGLATLGGAIGMKKLILGLVVLALAVGGAVLSRESARPASANASRPGEEMRDPQAGALLGVTTTADADAGTRKLQEATASTSLSCQAFWDEDGSPASGIGVRLVCASSNGLGPEPRAMTDAEGNVTFGALLPGRAALFGDRGGSTFLEIVQGEHQDAVLRVPKGILLQGRVVDAHDRPVEGARIWVSARPINTYLGMEVASSDADGRFELSGVERGRVVGARLSGFEAADMFVLQAQPGDVVERVFRIGGRSQHLTGIVRGIDGSPSQDSVVFLGEALHYVQTLPDGRVSTPAPVWVYPDDAGRFEADAPKGNLALWARSSDSATWHSTLEIEEGENWIEIQLQPSASVAGRVVDLEGAPSSKASIRAIQRALGPEPDGDSISFFGPSWAIPRAMSDEEGRFRLTNVIPGSTTVSAREFASTESRPRQIAAKLELNPGDEASCELVLGSAKTIAGFVVDEHDQAVPGIRVGGRDESGSHHLGSVVTDQAGRFELVDCSRERYAVFAFEPEAGVRPPIEAIGVAAGTQSVRIVFPTRDRATSSISGQLLRADGLPILEKEIQLNRQGAEGRSQGPTKSTSLKEGKFKTAALPAGRYLLELGDGITGVWTHFVDLPSNQDLDLGILEIPVPGRIELVLEGNHLAELNAHILMEGMPWAWGFPLRDGRGISMPLSPGPYRVGFKGYDGQALASVPVVVRSGETTAVTLPMKAAVRRKVRFPAVPQEDVVLTTTWFDARDQIVARDCWPVQLRASESPHEWHLVPGSYRVVVEALDGRKAEATFVVDESPESEEVLELPSPVVDSIESRTQPRGLPH